MTFKERAEIGLKELAKQPPATLKMARKQIGMLKLKNIKMEKLKVITDFLKEMKAKYPVDADSQIVLELDGNELVVIQVTHYEGDDLNELERIEIK